MIISNLAPMENKADKFKTSRDTADLSIHYFYRHSTYIQFQVARGLDGTVSDLKQMIIRRVDMTTACVEATRELLRGWANTVYTAG